MKAHNTLDPLTIQIAAAAFDETCRRLPTLPLEERALLAKRILGTAALGERDPAQMRDDALDYHRS